METYDRDGGPALLLARGGANTARALLDTRAILDTRYFNFCHSILFNNPPDDIDYRIEGFCSEMLLSLIKSSCL